MLKPRQVAGTEGKQHRCAIYVTWALAAALLASSVAVIVLERSDDTNVDDENSWSDHVRMNVRIEQQSAAVVPNYHKVWWARNLIFGNPDLRGNLQRRNIFGFDILQQKSDLTWSVVPWNEVCGLDSDKDGYTNGQELGDPCCIWEGEDGPDVAWSWDLTHPGGVQDAPNESMQKLIKVTDCDEVREKGQYPDYSDEFDAFFYRYHGGDDSFTDNLVRGIFLCIFSGTICWWVLEKELWRELLCFVTFSRRRATSSTLSLSTGLFIFVLAYLHNDLSSAFVHSFFDSCNHHHPLVGPQCRGTQYHHFKPRQQSLESTLLIIGNPIAVLPPAVVIPLYGYLGSGLRNPKWLMTGYQYPRWFEFLLLCLAIQSPLTYYFHQGAHTPAEDRPALVTWLQQMGLALSPEFHKMHHRLPNGTWSVLVGWMDFVPNFLVSLSCGGFGLSKARAALVAIYSMLVLPWYVWLLYFNFEDRHRRASIKEK